MRLTIAVQVAHDAPSCSSPYDIDRRAHLGAHREDVEKERVADSPVMGEGHDPARLVKISRKIVGKRIVPPFFDIGVLIGDHNGQRQVSQHIRGTNSPIDYPGSRA
jgi:hypothetical protein